MTVDEALVLIPHQTNCGLYWNDIRGTDLHGKCTCNREAIITAIRIELNGRVKLDQNLNIWRTGRKVARNLYCGDMPVAMLSTADLARHMADLLNSVYTLKSREIDVVTILGYGPESEMIAVAHEEVAARTRSQEAIERMIEELRTTREERDRLASEVVRLTTPSRPVDYDPK